MVIENVFWVEEASRSLWKRMALIERNLPFSVKTDGMVKVIILKVYWKRSNRVAIRRVGDVLSEAVLKKTCAKNGDTENATLFDMVILDHWYQYGIKNNNNNNNNFL